MWVALTLSFYGNLFSVGLSPSWFDSFEKYSSLIPEKTAMCKGLLRYDGPVLTKNPSNGYLDTIETEADCNDKNLVPYDSQYGLQSRIISAFAPSDDSKLPRYFKVVSLTLAAITAVLITLVLIRLRTLFGTAVAAVMAILIMMSPWITGYAINLYWIEPLMFAPFVVGLIGYPWFKERRLLWLFFVVELLLLFTKFLNGYEHASTLAISVLVPVIFYETYTYKRKLTSLWKQAVTIGAVSVIALVGAIAVNILSLSKYYGSWDVASQHMTQRTEARGIKDLPSMQPYVVKGFKATVPVAYNFVDRFIDLDSLEDGKAPKYKYLLLSALNYALLPALSLPVGVNGMFGVIVQSVIFVGLIGFLCIRYLKTSKRYKKFHYALLCSYWVSLAGALSWLILMPGHTYPHAHINAIVFYLPYLFICYLVIGCVITSIFESLNVHFMGRDNKGKR